MSAVPASAQGDRAIGVWLLAICALVFAMVFLGGWTRLGHAGLSIVEWKPIAGAIPPLDDAAWEAEFANYRAYPEYRLLNRDMTLAEFKEIYRLEYAHRLLGRLIGVVFLVPFAWFLAKRRIPRALVPKLVFLFALGALQGFAGWFMVKSGLVERPDVSHYRLTLHLGLALWIYAAALWLALGHLWPLRTAPLPSGVRVTAIAVLALIAVTIASGGFVAGTDAGFLANTFPTMDGAWVPGGVIAQQPWWRNPLENRLTIQFQHRVLAALVFVAVVALWFRARRERVAMGAFHALLALALLQGTLGALTVVHRVPLTLGLAHQAGAVALLTAAIVALRR